MELKDLQTQLQTAFTELKAAGERQENELKKYGTATDETKTMITTINAEMDKIKNRMDEVETKANRTEFSGGQGGAQENTEQKAAFFKFFREGKAGLTVDERKALVQDTTGEIIVPEALDAELYRELPKLTIMRGLAAVRNIDTNRIRRRSMNEVSVGWGKLETTATQLGAFESSLSPSEEYLYVENVYGLTKVGEDELEDTDQNLTSYITSSFAQAFAAAEDLAFIKGTGHANTQPEGILNGTTVTRFNAAAVGAIEADDFIKLAYEVPAQYRRNGSYIVNSKTELAIRLFKDSNGQYLWQPSLQSGTPATFNGRPVYTQDDMPEVAAGADAAVFGDIKQGYQILNRNGGAITRINELYIEDGLIGFKYRRRVGGGVVRANAMRILNVPSV